MTADGTPGLVEWLREQVDADERAAQQVGGRWILRKLGRGDLAELIAGDRSGVVVLDGPGATDCAEHMARWDPARVLAEVAAKREILAKYQGALMQAERTPDDPGNRGYVVAMSHAIAALARPYAGRRGWRAEWAAGLTPGLGPPVTTQDDARAALVEATRVREEAEPGWRQAVLGALAAGIGATEVARLAHITRGRVHQIRVEARGTLPPV